MHHFQYQNNELFAEEVALSRIAAEVGTPAYVYSTATLTRHYKVFDEALNGLDRTVCFATKSNSNPAVIRTLAKLGSGADVVSEGEARVALQAGIPPEKIVFSGVGKTRSELAFAIEAGIGQINVEGLPELDVLSEVAAGLGKTAAIALRVNPDVDAGTHEKITTGKAENKFGIAWADAPEAYRKAASLPGINVRSVAVHIGSQITTLVPFRAAFEKVAGLVRDLRDQGIGITHIDLGGGLGVPYDHGAEHPPTPQEYGDVVRDVFGDMDAHLMFEPGRVIAGNAGVLLTEVIYVKHGQARDFVIVDAGMNDLARPAMYGAVHETLPVVQSSESSGRIADLVGPVCETGDTFAKGLDLPSLATGDRLALLTAGAYGAVMASTYNTRALIPEVLVNGSDYAVVRKRPSLDEMMSLNVTPDWLA